MNAGKINLRSGANLMLNAAEAMNLTAENLVLIEPKVEDYQILIDGAIMGTQVTAQMANVLVVFDSRVQELELLYDAIMPGAVGYTIDAQQDALTEITRLLTQTGARRLAIVAHGEPGVVHIGANPLNREQLQAMAHLLQEWGIEEIALYSYEVGKDVSFITELERLTGTGVAAATGKVGAAAEGGSWELEVTTQPRQQTTFTGNSNTGISESKFFTSQSALERFTHILAVVNDTASLNEDSATITGDLNANDTGADATAQFNRISINGRSNNSLTTTDTTPSSFTTTYGTFTIVPSTGV